MVNMAIPPGDSPPRMNGGSTPSSGPQLPPDILDSILSYLSLPPSSTLPSPPLTFLSTHIAQLPLPLLQPFSALLSPRQRAVIPTIKSRRLLFSATSPSILSARKGRLRWPLLWESLGGSGIPDPSGNDEDEEAFGRDLFMEGENQHVKKLGGLLREYEEEREMESVRERRRVERRLMEEGEEFDESDDESPVESSQARPVGGGDQEAIGKVFEKRLLELFVDGLDTIDYDEIDFVEPTDGDPIKARDEEDAWFDDEEPSVTSSDGRLGTEEYDY
ncbi:hypothetical protein P7C73_g300, partial [Tremellales sp. Uapishka_1]